MNLKTPCLIIAACLGLMAFMESALADEDLLPIGQSLAPDQVEEHMVMTEVVPEANPDLAFRMLIPRGWVQDEPPGIGQPVSAERFNPLLAMRDGNEARLLPEAQAFGLMVGLLSDAGLEVSDEFETITLDMTDSSLETRAGRTDRAVQADGARTRTVQMMLFNVAGESLRVWQIKPERDIDFLRWAISGRALQIMLSTMVLDD